jgi:hypothetical protein
VSLAERHLARGRRAMLRARRRAARRGRRRATRAPVARVGVARTRLRSDGERQSSSRGATRGATRGGDRSTRKNVSVRSTRARARRGRRARWTRGECGDARTHPRRRTTRE